MACESLTIVRPTVSEVKMLSEATKRPILANNDVITKVCK